MLQLLLTLVHEHGQEIARLPRPSHVHGAHIGKSDDSDKACAKIGRSVAVACWACPCAGERIARTFSTPASSPTSRSIPASAPSAGASGGSTPPSTRYELGSSGRWRRKRRVSGCFFGLNASSNGTLACRC